MNIQTLREWLKKDAPSVYARIKKDEAQEELPTLDGKSNLTLNIKHPIPNVQEEKKLK